jgi:hypothetical protein
VWYNLRTMSNELPQPDYRQTLHASVVQTAHALISKSIGVVEAARQLMELAAELDALDDDDFEYFIDVDSQSDGFPVGIARQQWDSAALEREDQARRTFEESVYAEAVTHCRSLIAHYSPTV